jgi:predicted metal-dependent hydrolase
MQVLPGLHHFTASRFIIDNPDGPSMSLDMLMPLVEQFYHARADEKLPGRVRYWERQTGLQAAGMRIRHFQSRWASCNARNVLQFHPRVMELATSVQDYVIVHELCHTVEKTTPRHSGSWYRDICRIGNSITRYWSVQPSATPSETV